MLKMIFIALCLQAAASCASMPKIFVFHDPLTPREHINLGLAYQNNGETQHAVSEFQTAAKKLPEAYLYLGNLYFEKKEPEKAKAAYQKAISENNKLSDAYNNLAWLYYTQKDNLDEALALAQKAVLMAPDNPTYRDTLNKIKESKSLP